MIDLEPKYLTLTGWLTGVECQRPKDILQEVSEKTGISIERIKSKSRKEAIKNARHYYMRRAYYMLPEIGITKIAAEVNRDHATVITSLNAIESKLHLMSEYKRLFPDENTLSRPCPNRRANI